MSYRIEWEQDAVDALDRLDNTIVHRILLRISWLSTNLDNIKPQALAENLKGYFKLRWETTGLSIVLSEKTGYSSLKTSDIAETSINLPERMTNLYFL